MSEGISVVNVVPSFHYDIEYLLPIDAYMEICFQNLLEAHRLLNEYPEYTYRIEQTFLLEQFFREYPSLREDFQRFADEGRFEVASGMYAMADINMASGESILRQLTVGKQIAKKLLGLNPVVLDMGDCTGHPASMPQIAKHCGYKYFVFERAIDDVNRKCEIRWKGIDGTEILTYWLAVYGYAGWCQFPRENIEQDLGVLTELVNKLEKCCMCENALLAHGGDFKYPYEKGILAVRKWNRKENERVKIMYSTYERGLNNIDFSRAPLEICEWNPDRQGCYSSRIRIKQGNRQCESLIFAAEVMSVVAEKFFNIKPDTDSLLRAWKLTFINQFHDIFWGTICDEAYQHTLERISRIRMICQNVIEDRLKLFLDSLIEVDSDVRKIAVFNPLPWPRKCIIEIPLKNDVIRARVKDMKGQYIDAYVRKDKLVFATNLSSCGVNTFVVEEKHHKQQSSFSTVKSDLQSQSTPFEVNRISVNNEMCLEVITPKYKVQFASGGVISSLIDCRTNIEFVDSARPAFNSICYQSDRGDLWQYYDGPLHDGGEYGPEQDLIDDPYPTSSHFITKNGKRLYGDVLDNRNGPQAKFEIIEANTERLIIGIKGTLSRKMPMYREFENEEIKIDWQQTVTFYADDPQIDFHLETLHTSGKWYRLRVAFFTDIKSGIILHEIPFGCFERKEGEFAAQNYIAYYNDDKGLILLNNGLPGNNVTDGVVMLSLMRSVSIHTRTKSEQAFELGQNHIFDYAIIPFSGRDKLDEINPARRGVNFINPPYIFDTYSCVQRNDFRLPVRISSDKAVNDSFCVLNSDSIVCTAIYPKNREVIIRLYESFGKKTTAELTFYKKIKSVCQADAMLENKVEIAADDVHLKLTFRPFEIKTLLVNM